MNKNTILNVTLGIVSAATIILFAYVIIQTKIQTNINSADIQEIGNYINNQIKASQSPSTPLK